VRVAFLQPMVAIGDYCCNYANMSEPERTVATNGTPEPNAALLDAAARVRVVLQANRSDRLLRLFDYGDFPSEQQIAAEAFGTERLTDGGQDANVRVYVHRLRKVLQAAPPEPGGRVLAIPLGEYRIRLIEPGGGAAGAGSAAGDGGRSAALPSAAAGRFRLPGIGWLAAVLLALAAAALGWWALSRESSPLGDVPVWRELSESDRPLVIVVGDYYMFAELAPGEPRGGGQPQLIWDQAVPTREDLTIKQMLEPGKADQVIDYGQQFVSAGTIGSLSLLRASVASVPALRRKPVRLVSASELTPEMLGSADILYVGQLSGLTVLLRDPLSQASGFRIEPGFGGLTDQRTGEHYQSDGMVLTDERIPRRDFAYLASLPGPSGNRLVIVAGLGEAGLKEAVRVLGDPARMRRLGRSLPEGGQGFEVLQRVRTIRDVNVGATPILERPLRSSAIWDSPGNVAPYRPIAAPVGSSTSDGGPAAGTNVPSDRE